MLLVVFEDEQVTNLYPITVGRPAFAVTCGGYRLVDLLERFACPAVPLVRPHLQTIVALDFPQFAAADEVPALLEQTDDILLVNARLVPSAKAVDELRQLCTCSKGTAVESDGYLVAAWLPRKKAAELVTKSGELLFDRIEEQIAERHDLSVALLRYPHDVVKFHLEIFSANLEDRLRRGHYRQHEPGVYLGEKVRLGQYLVADTSDGPIVIDDEAHIGPHSYLAGPVYIGRRARVNEHGSIKDNVCLQHTTKVGGEVEASVIEAYTNKQHHGFLGHSYVGSWVNMGAGTCNSDLKNTYGTVTMVYNGRKVSTGMQFLGCIVGDYAKTAINTGIFTGKTIGVCSMVYGFVTTNVPSFVNYARSFGQITEVPVEVEIATQARMFRRRNVEQRPCDIQLLHDMYELTRHERRLANEPLSL